jgi:hypothetical protein
MGILVVAVGLEEQLKGAEDDAQRAKILASDVGWVLTQLR